MITYELAKQLKDAGFPQTGKGDLYTPGGKQRLVLMSEWTINMLRMGRENGESTAEFAYIPTLSELIEACMRTGLLEDFTLQMEHTEWNAWGRDYGSSVESGSSPEEAVAELWLALNKK